MNRLREYRESQGLTREQFALRAGISAEYVRRLEAGLHSPSLDVARTICGVLGTSIDDTFPAAPCAVAVME